MRKNLFIRFFSVLMIFTLVCTSLVACTKGGANEAGSGNGTQSDSTDVKKPSGKPLVVGVQSSIISVPTVYAYEQGYFDEAGLNIELVIFPNGAPENEGLAAKQLDIASNGLASVFPMASGLVTLVAETDTTVGSAAIYARPDNPLFDTQGELKDTPDVYGTAEALKGQSILGPTGTISQHMAYAYMDRFGLKSGEEFEFLNMDTAAATQAFIAGEGDIIACSTPFMYQLETAGMKKVASYEDATLGTFLNGILSRNDVLEERRAEVVLFLEVMYKASEELMADPQKRFDFSMKFYTENGKEFTDEELWREIEERDFVTLDYMKQDGYIMGEGLLNTGRFFATVGTIDESQVDNLSDAIDVSLLKDALDIDVAGAK